ALLVQNGAAVQRLSNTQWAELSALPRDSVACRARDILRPSRLCRVRMKRDSDELAGPSRARTGCLPAPAPQRPALVHRSNLHFVNHDRGATRLLSAKPYLHRRLRQEKPSVDPTEFPLPLERPGRLRDIVQASLRFSPLNSRNSQDRARRQSLCIVRSDTLS